MRNAFIDELVVLAKKNSNLVLMVGDLGFSVVEPFQDQFPDRFFNAGVAEQNMMGMAAGLASEGCHVFIYSIANFPTFRCAEQIRNDVAYHKLPVTIVSVGGGVAYGNLGYSHHAIQDYALMRVMPNMLIASPGDSMEVRGCMRYLVENPQPSYLRLNKSGEENLNHFIPDLKPGILNKVEKNSRSSINILITTGYGLQIANSMKKQIKYADYDLYSLPLWGIDYKEIQQEQLANFSQIITVEDHIRDAGFGSWLQESLDSNQLFKLKAIALDKDCANYVATQEELLKKFMS